MAGLFSFVPSGLVVVRSATGGSPLRCEDSWLVIDSSSSEPWAFSPRGGLWCEAFSPCVSNPSCEKYGHRAQRISEKIPWGGGGAKQDRSPDVTLSFEGAEQRIQSRRGRNRSAQLQPSLQDSPSGAGRVKIAQSRRAGAGVTGAVSEGESCRDG